MSQRNEHQNGFTLVELLVYLGLVSMVIVVLSSFLVSVSRNAAQAKIDNEVLQNARLIFSRLTQEVRTATAIDTNASVFNNPEGKITLVKNGTSTSFYRDALTNTVYDEVPGMVTNLSNSHVCVTQLEFTYTAPTVGMSITVAPSNDCASASKSVFLQTAVIPRRLLY